MKRRDAVRKLIIEEFISLDGVIQAPGGIGEDIDGDFLNGAWTRPYWHDEIGAHFMNTMKDCDAFLLGRKTWKTHSEAFNPLPAEDVFGDIMNRMQKYAALLPMTQDSSPRFGRWTVRSPLVVPTGPIFSACSPRWVAARSARWPASHLRPPRTVYRLLWMAIFGEAGVAEG
jgi:hypothetical protein